MWEPDEDESDHSDDAGNYSQKPRKDSPITYDSFRRQFPYLNSPDDPNAIMGEPDEDEGNHSDDAGNNSEKPWPAKLPCSN